MTLQPAARIEMGFCLAAPQRAVATYVAPVAVAYQAAFFSGGVQVGDRFPFTASNGNFYTLLGVPAPGTYTVRVFSEDGLTLVSETAPFTVPAAPGASTPAPATTGTLSGVPTSGTAGTALATGGTFSLTNAPSSGITAYVGLLNMATSAYQGVFQAVAGSSGSLPALTPASAGTYAVRLCADSAGATVLATSPIIAVAAGLTAPNAVSNLVGVASTQSTTRINLSWTESGGAPTTRTALIRPTGSGTYVEALSSVGFGGGSVVGVVTGANSYNPLTANTVYDIQVILSNNAGTSPAATVTNVSTAAVATAATAPVPTPSGATVGVEISGLTSTITPVGGIAWAALHDGTAEVGSRAPFGGTAVRGLTPTTAGANHTIRIYAGPFTTPALATSATFAVAAAAGSGQLITFTGAAGAPTGNQVLVPGFGSAGSIAGVALNGSSSLIVQNASGKFGLFKNFGAQSADGTMTVQFADGATNKAIELVARASEITVAAVFVYVTDDGGLSQATLYDGATGANLGASGSYTTPASAYSLTMAGSTLTLKADTATVATFTNVANTAGGFIGIGAGNNPSALIKQLSFT